MKRCYNISKQCIENTIYCNRQHACLRSALFPVCDVVDERVGSCLIVQQKFYIPLCGYHYEIRDKNGEPIHVCYCGVRKEIYEKYNE